MPCWRRESASPGKDVPSASIDHDVQHQTAAHGLPSFHGLDERLPPVLITLFTLGFKPCFKV